YVFQAKIGNGAFGTVYRAVHSYTGATFAVKEIHKLGKQSLREPAILQSLSHRNIVKFIEFISMDQDNTMIVMELVHGLNLEILHAQSPFTLDDTRELATEMLFGLDYLHSNRITHRDLKPANILVPQRNPIHIKITDFGLAVARSQQLKTNCGTALYLAPEVLSEACYTNKVDLWSLGVIALELVLGLPDYP
ncbi:kinase-like protein, partial [Cryphonectria parasitica EP155]